MLLQKVMSTSECLYFRSMSTSDTRSRSLKRKYNNYLKHYRSWKYSTSSAQFSFEERALKESADSDEAENRKRGKVRQSMSSASADTEDEEEEEDGSTRGYALTSEHMADASADTGDNHEEDEEERIPRGKMLTRQNTFTLGSSSGVPGRNSPRAEVSMFCRSKSIYWILIILFFSANVTTPLCAA